MNTKWIAFGLVGLMASAAFGQEVKPFYIKGTSVITQGDLRAYAGGKSTGYAIECGYDFHRGQDLIGYSIFAAYQRVNGDVNHNLVPVDTQGHRAALETKFGVDTWRCGVDLRFTTPVKGLTPFAGLNANFHKGFWSNNSPVLGPSGTLPDHKAKFGARIGVEYLFLKDWAATVEYDATEWRSGAHEYVDPVTQTTVRRGKGYNPVNPSWLGVSVSYRFNWDL